MATQHTKLLCFWTLFPCHNCCVHLKYFILGQKEKTPQISISHLSDFIWRKVFLFFLFSSFFQCVSVWIQTDQRFSKCNMPDKKIGADIPLPRHFHQLHWGNPKVFPGQPRDGISQTCSRSGPDGHARNTSPPINQLSSVGWTEPEIEQVLVNRSMTDRHSWNRSEPLKTGNHIC